MNERLQISLSEVSPRRLAYAVAALSFSLLVLHPVVVCEVSGMFYGFSVLLLAVAAGFCLMQRRSARDRFRPLTWAVVAFVANRICTH